MKGKEMSEIDNKIEQCKRDIEAFQKELTRLEKKKKDKEKPFWIAAVSPLSFLLEE